MADMVNTEIDNDILYIVIPAYNEEENIQDVVLEWYDKLLGKNPLSKLVIADAGSTDNTHEILLSLQNDYPQLVVLEDTKKEHGPKVLSLYQYAISMHADYIFQTDSDRQTTSSDFDKFWNGRETNDFVIGNRTKRGDGIARLIVEKIVCIILFFFFGVHVPDANAPFRLMKTNILYEYLRKMPKDNKIPNIILTALFVYYKERVHFLDISFAKRKKGRNSINLWKICKIGIQAIPTFFEIKKSIMEINGVKSVVEHCLKISSFSLFILVGLYKLTNSSLWYDETIEYWYSKYMFGMLPNNIDVVSKNMYERIASTYQPPLYNILLWVWLKISSTEWWFRFSGVVISFVGLVGLWRAVKESINSYVASLVIIICSFTYRFIYYTQECAEYVLVVAMISWTLYYFVRCIMYRKTNDIVLFTVFCVLSVFSQYGAAFSVLSMCTCVFVMYIIGKEWKSLKILSISYAIAFLLSGIPLLYFFLLRQIEKQQSKIVRTSMPFKGGVFNDCYISFREVLKWNFLPDLSRIGFKIFIILLLIVIFVSCIFGKSKISKMLSVVNTITWIVYYFSVKYGFYAQTNYSGGFGCRYNIFLIPQWIIGFMLVLYDIYILLGNEENKKTRYQYTCICAMLVCVCAFCYTGWDLKLKNNWSKEDIRGAVNKWYELDGYKFETIVYQTSNAGFSYYLLQNPQCKPDIDYKVHYLSPKNKATEEIKELLVLQNSDSCRFFITSHISSDAEKEVMDLFAEQGFMVDEEYNNHNGKLYRIYR